MSCAVGARRTGLGYGLADMARAPLYWSLLSLAFLHAVWRLATEPFVWDKTPHERDRDRLEEATDAGREAA
jgi:glycosyltransferase XagB